MDNATLASQLKLLSRLMDIHGESTFKIRSYANAAFQIERHPRPLKEMTENDIFQIKGIGEAIGKKIIALLNTGQLSLLEKYLENTPEGILEMLRIKGLGPKKIGVVWKELGIENVGELLYACNENRLLLYKGFGAKTQENIRLAIEFYVASQGQFLFAKIEDLALQLIQHFKNELGENVDVSLTEDIRRQCNTLDKIALVISRPSEEIRQHIPAGFEIIAEEKDYLILNNGQNTQIKIFPCKEETFGMVLFHTTGSKDFLETFFKKYPSLSQQRYATEKEIFNAAGLPEIPAFYRENALQLATVEKKGLPPFIQPFQMKGIIHAHSSWSDGKNSLKEMALHAKSHGFEYLVISDHSQSAVYAKGLNPERIKAQHEQIDELNEKLFPFKIFKSIEADILNDGSLDYTDTILSTFDLVIASIHSNLKMDEQKAMQRLLRAIENPYTTILGHCTGRLLLSRSGYPVNHKKIIESCAQHNVAIEINANPRRLDMDWSWIPYALECGVLLSIDPDAHSLAGMKDVRYGVLSAQKGGLTAAKNLSSFSLEDFETFLIRSREK